MRTKVASFFIFFQELSNKKKIRALRPKMTKIASRGGSCLNFGLQHLILIKFFQRERERENGKRVESERSLCSCLLRGRATHSGWHRKVNELL